MKKLTHEEIISRQKELMTKEKLPFVVVLNDIRSLHNVGSIFRTADGVGISRLYLCGITGCPPSNRINKIALGSEDTVEWRYYKDPAEIILKLKKEGYEIVLLEQMKESINYLKYKPKKPVCLIIGNEVEGVSDSIVSLADKAIEIEMTGVKNSLNVGVALGVVAYHIKACLSKK